MVKRISLMPRARIFGVLFIATSIILSILYPLFDQNMIRLAELVLSADHQINPEGQRQLVSVYYFVLVIVFCIGYYLFKAQDEVWRAELRRVFFEEPLCRTAIVQPTPRLVFFLSSIAGILLILSLRLAYKFTSMYPFLYQKDHGVMDILVPITFTVSVILLSLAVWRIWNDHAFSQYRVFLSVVYTFMALLFIIYVGEEISWGQDFFAWKTSLAFSGNLENQTNIHNYFNDYFDYGYISLSMILVVILVSTWLEYNRYGLPYNRLILPHPSLLGLSLLIAFVSIVWFHEQELLEELTTVFVFFYCLRLNRCFCSGKVSLDHR
jgi:hypothetical protein